MKIYTLLAYKELPPVVEYCLEKNKNVGITYLSEKDMYDLLPFLDTDKFTIQQKSDMLRYYLLGNEPCWWIDATVEVKDSSVFNDNSFELAEKHDDGSLDSIGERNFWNVGERITIDSFIEQSLTAEKQRIYKDVFDGLKADLIENSDREYLYVFGVKSNAYRKHNYVPELSFVSADTAEAMGFMGDSSYFVKHTVKIPDFMSDSEKEYLQNIERKIEKWLEK